MEERASRLSVSIAQGVETHPARFFTATGFKRRPAPQMEEFAFTFPRRRVMYQKQDIFVSLFN
jgi:hypothetical protein